MENYLSAEALIKARLLAEVPEFQGRNVFSAAEIENVPEAAQVAPAAHVLYGGDQVLGGSSASCTLSTADQEWFVVIATRNVRSTRTGEDARSEAGVIISKVLRALQGWQMSNDHSPLRRTNSQYKLTPGYKAGFAYIPLVFTTRVNA